MEKKQEEIRVRTPEEMEKARAQLAEKRKAMELSQNRRNVLEMEIKSLEEKLDELKHKRYNESSELDRISYVFRCYERTVSEWEKQLEALQERQNLTPGSIEHTFMSNIDRFDKDKLFDKAETKKKTIIHIECKYCKYIQDHILYTWETNTAFLGRLEHSGKICSSCHFTTITIQYHLTDEDTYYSCGCVNKIRGIDHGHMGIECSESWNRCERHNDPGEIMIKTINVITRSSTYL
jgi:hypothetical protein